ncbi:hypothetical protein [Methylobacterium radiotolerans]|uniref:Uncharacterized protein n=2 Tax=Methylobacterium TaxID=407 RepID=B1M222_METRJ|nr:hypothetical protein [Methylobacterium radiotolerans]ACB24633.1 hypothetical protein Mrad2831_2649 [Methylobacterium radiotolerans JCM 2831]GEM97094.1 hypothetical protein MRA01_16340 [Methylobacterium radiotolerans]
MNIPVPWVICKLSSGAAAAATAFARIEDLAPDLAEYMPGALARTVPTEAINRVSAWFASMDHPGVGAPAYLFALDDRGAYVVARFDRPGVPEDGVMLRGVSSEQDAATLRAARAA